MAAAQLNLFGDPCPTDKIPGYEPKIQRRKTMQEIHGVDPIHKCQNCKHILKIKHIKIHYKCKLWSLSKCPSTDIRLKQNACRKFEVRQGGIVTAVINYQ